MTTDTPPPPTRRRQLTAVAAAAGVIALAGLGVFLASQVADGEEGTRATTSTTPPTTTSPTTTATATSTTEPPPHTIPTLIEVDPAHPNADVLLAYERATRALLEANAVSDPNYPALLATTQGEALELARSSIEVLRNQRQRALFEGRIARLEVVERTEATATVQACGVDQGRLVDIDTGQRLDDGSVTLNALVEVLMLVEGTWKVDHGLLADTAICEGVEP